MILETEKLKENIYTDIKKRVKDLENKNITPTLSIIRIGKDPGSISYEKSILNTLEPLGINIIVHELPLDVQDSELLDLINNLNNDKTIHGELVFKPIPESLNKQQIYNSINPKKDVDAISPVTLGKIVLDDNNALKSATPEGVVRILEFNDIDVLGKNITIVNNTDTFGKPLALMLTAKGATVTICSIYTENLKEFTKNADILITGAGVPDLIKPDMINNNSVIIDIGVSVKPKKNKDVKTILVGDVNASCGDIAKKISSITPGLGGGVGSITTAILASNILKATEDLERI